MICQYHPPSNRPPSRHDRPAPPAFDRVRPADLAAWLSRHHPRSPVRHAHLPDWLRLAWLRSVRPAYRWGRRPTASWSVTEEIREALDRAGFWFVLDHWGSTRIAGVTALVVEPYLDLDATIRAMRHLAAVVGGTAAYAHESAWGAGTVRGLLFPPGKAARAAA